MTALDSTTETEAIRRAGLSENNRHVRANQEAVKLPSMSKLLSKAQAVAKIEAFCLDIMSRDAETPLKHSDKVAAARLLADLKGTNDTKHTVDVNIGVLDLRHASDEELAAELDRLEKEKPVIIDAVSKDVQDSTLS
jgi:MoxR-like ATPase